MDQFAFGTTDAFTLAATTASTVTQRNTREYSARGPADAGLDTTVNLPIHSADLHRNSNHKRTTAPRSAMYRLVSWIV
jgi:hypothetical protein